MTFEHDLAVLKLINPPAQLRAIKFADVRLEHRNGQKPTVATGKLVVVDNGWTTCGASAEILAGVAERLQDRRPRVQRLGFAPVTCPTTRNLEDLFYPDAPRIAAAAYALVRGRAPSWTTSSPVPPEIVEFRGPF